MSILRFFMLLSLVVWLGAIIFFGMVVAPTLFSVLPTRQLAGAVVTRTLSVLHWMGLVSGVVFAITSMTYSRLTAGVAQPLAPRHMLIYVMIALVLFSQFFLSARMNQLRVDMGEIDRISQDDPRRVEFNRLHHWSTRVEVTVLGLGLAVLYLTARRLH
jgi:hypothetical protein